MAIFELLGETAPESEKALNLRSGLRFHAFGQRHWVFTSRTHRQQNAPCTSILVRTAR